MSERAIVRTGLDRLLASGPGALRKLRVGLIANQTTVDGRLRHGADRLREMFGDGLVRLFAPEHGLRGEAQDMAQVSTCTDARTGLEVVSLYGRDEMSLTPPATATADLDALVFDVQDIGSRYYTFQATMALAMQAAQERRLLFVVLDRPNPLGGHQVEGNVVDAGFRSFVGLHPIAVRHGMTVGELARYYARVCGIAPELQIVELSGWARRLWWDETGLTWVMPSPNMPTLDTATVYPGMCLVEGTNLSEGRGTTRPFELVGAPWLDGSRLRADLESQQLAGVEFREVAFRPTFHKHAGLVCEGVQLHVSDRSVFEPFLVGIAVVAAARRQNPELFGWREEVYEFVGDRLAFDLLAGGTTLRDQIEGDVPLPRIAESWQEELTAFQAARGPALLYE